MSGGLSAPYLELVVGVVRVLGPHKVELGRPALGTTQDLLLEALPVLGDEGRGLVDDGPDVRRGEDQAGDLALRGLLQLAEHALPKSRGKQALQNVSRKRPRERSPV